MATAVLLPMQGCGTRPSQPAASHDDAVVEIISAGGSGGWDFLTFDPVGQRLFIARSNRVQVWSAQDRRVVNEITGTDGVHGVALAQDLNRGFTTNGRANTISVFGLGDLKITATIAIPGRNPDAILYEPMFKRIYAFNGRSEDVTVIDARTLEILASIPLGGKPEVAVSNGAGRIFVNIEDTAELVALDPATNKVLTRWPLDPCVAPTGLALDKAHQRLFAVCANGKMVVVDATSGRLVAEAPIGGEPDGVEFDAGLGVAISANGEGTLTLVREVDPDHFATVGTVRTQARARTLALDPLTHRIFLVTAVFGAVPAPTPAQPRPRPEMVADTFTILVVTPK